MATRIGVDVGGTFTDLTMYDDVTGTVAVGKVPTTPSAPEQGVLAAVERTVSREHAEAAAYFLHGTTVGLNALLTRTGASVGLLATRGFRDIIEIRRGDRDEMFNLFWKMPPPLVPRRRRLPVTERVTADGSILEPLSEADISAALAVFDEEKVSCIAIAFLNAYANPVHELEAAAVLRRLGYEGEISLSHEVSGEYREYERTTTTIVDAYVRPKMASYLRVLDEGLRTRAFAGQCLVTRSGGGAMTFDEAERRPFETIMSGPVAGAEGAAELARALDLGDVISADVGGTSFDTCLVVQGRPQVMYEGNVEGLPIQSPWVDVRSIGAGGGSIAHVDVGNLLRVGPQSAGAVPGPACYDRGGTEPTVTDAAFYLGMLADGALAGGVALRHALAEDALRPLAGQLGMSEEQVAQGVLRIATAAMANAIREITIEQGHDPRKARLMPFGGAGPLFGCLLARELEMREIVVPPYAGNFSAWGLLGADLTQSASRTRLITVNGSAALDEAAGVLSELFDALSERASGAGTAAEKVAAIDMRYVGQEHYLTIDVPWSDGRIAVDPDDLLARFHDEYVRTYRHSLDEDVEIVNVRATLRTELPRGSERFASGQSQAAVTKTTTHRAYSFIKGEWMDFDVYDRDRLPDGATLEGPAIVLEDTTTFYVDAGFTAAVGAGRCLFVHDDETKG